LYILKQLTHFLLSKKARLTSSSIDIILFGLVSKTNTATNLDIANELFRLLRPNGYLVTHLDHAQKTQAIGHFKMCGFDSCNPLDSNSSFLIINKDDDVKRLGSLWLCQKPSFDIGFSVSLHQSRPSLITQKSIGSGGKKTWIIEEDLSDTDDLQDGNEFDKSHVKSKPYVQIRVLVLL
jgi:hypothetical protein